jgi:hypothetical protein
VKDGINYDLDATQSILPNDFTHLVRFKENCIPFCTCILYTELGLLCPHIFACVRMEKEILLPMHYSMVNKRWWLLKNQSNNVTPVYHERKNTPTGINISIMQYNPSIACPTEPSNLNTVVSSVQEVNAPAKVNDSTSAFQLLFAISKHTFTSIACENSEDIIAANVPHLLKHLHVLKENIQNDPNIVKPKNVLYKEVYGCSLLPGKTKKRTKNILQEIFSKNKKRKCTNSKGIQSKA